MELIQYTLTVQEPVMKTAEFTNSVDPDEVAHHEPPHQDLHCLSSSLQFLNVLQLDKTVV